MTQISVDLLNSAQVARQLASIAPKMRRNTTRAIVQAAQPIVAQARSNASWSTRIPGAISARVSYGGGPKSGVLIRVDANKAPHARPYEGITRGDTFRHPVFEQPGRQTRWVAQKSRPFIAPAIESHRGQVRAGIEQAISDALRV